MSPTVNFLAVVPKRGGSRGGIEELKLRQSVAGPGMETSLGGALLTSASTSLTRETGSASDSRRLRSIRDTRVAMQCWQTSQSNRVARWTEDTNSEINSMPSL